jgi:hypothetical protein
MGGPECFTNVDSWGSRTEPLQVLFSLKPTSQPQQYPEHSSAESSESGFKDW